MSVKRKYDLSIFSGLTDDVGEHKFLRSSKITTDIDIKLE